MTLVDDIRTGGFVFTWSIQNYSYSLQKENGYIDSPKFIVEFLKDYTWYLRLYPRGSGAPGFISYYLKQEGKASIVNSVLSIRASNGLFKEIDRQIFNTNSSSQEGYKYFLSFDELKGSDVFLDNDTLTLRCRIWVNETQLATSTQCYAHTKFEVTKLDYVWTMNEIIDSVHNNHIIHSKFNQTKTIGHFSPQILSLKIHLLCGGNFGDDTIHFGIEQPENTPNLFVNCIIHLLDADGRVAHSARGEHLFACSNKIQLWNFPLLSKCQLLSKKNLYLPNGKLSLHCEFLTSTGAQHDEVGRYECGISENTQLKTLTDKQIPDLLEPWKENMLRLYNEKKFSDVTFRTPNSQFSVHKAILCAQSEVFSAMFERDMKESQTGVVDIKDLEDETVSKMLMFLYTNTLDNVDYPTVYKLYFAADKYQITALHRKCLDFLIHNLDTSNVCDVLVLADTHQDQELKSVAQDFIFVHDREIMNSEYWMKLMEVKAHLTSEIMHLMICKKFIGYLEPVVQSNSVGTVN